MVLRQFYAVFGQVVGCDCFDSRNLEKSSGDSCAQLSVRKSSCAGGLLQQTTGGFGAIQFISDLFVAQLFSISHNLFGTNLVVQLIVQSTLLRLDGNFAVNLVLDVTVLVVVQSILNQLIDLQLRDDGSTITIIPHTIQWDPNQCSWNISNDARLM